MSCMSMSVSTASRESSVPTPCATADPHATQPGVSQKFPNFPTLGQASQRTRAVETDPRRFPAARAIVAAVLLLAAVACAFATIAHAADRAVTSVVVQFDDGTTQTVPAAPPTPTPPTPELPPAPPTTPPPDKPFLGVNLEGLRDYDRQFMFIDVIKTSRRWGSADKPYDGNGAVGADGWPSGDAGTFVMTEVRNINGLYKFSATGRCDLSTPGSPAKVINLFYDPPTNRTTADVLVNAPENKIVTLALAFKNTSTGLKDIKLLRPGYQSDQQIFTSEFLNSLRPFGAVRFMDYMKTNNSLLVKWDKRPQVTDPQYTQIGGPIERAIDLGNVLDKDIWLCVPALADDDYVRQLGQLVRERLKPALHCYVEYSNEVWNGQFKQFHQNAEAARADVAAGDATLSEGGKDSNVHYWARKRIARRGVEIKKLLGDDAQAGQVGRFRVVLASQVGFSPPGALLKQQLDYVEKHHGPPAKFFYAVACAPYFSPGKDETDPEKKKWFTQRTDLTVDLLCDRLLARATTTHVENVRAFHALARQHNLKSLAYEGGLDLQQFPTQVDVKTASQYDLRTGQAIENYLTAWYESGGDAMFYFTLSCKYSRNGYWGLTEDIRDLLTPKYLAATRVSSRLREGK